MDSVGQATQRVEIKAIQTCVDSCLVYIIAFSFERSCILLVFFLWSTLKNDRKRKRKLKLAKSFESIHSETSDLRKWRGFRSLQCNKE